tara:strand:+ start:165 stop:707 length:543 start_codon:yes stop_codon:yes gene_type:complete
MEQEQQDAEITGDDTREEISAKVSVVDVFVNSNTEGSSDNNSSTEGSSDNNSSSESSSDNNSSSEAKVDSIQIIARLAAGSEDTNVSVIYYSIMCWPEEQGLVFANGTLADSTPTELDGSPLTNESTLDSGQIFKFIVHLGDCAASVGENLDILMIVEEGGGESRVSLEVDSTTVGSRFG